MSEQFYAEKMLSYAENSFKFFFKFYFGDSCIFSI